MTTSLSSKLNDPELFGNDAGEDERVEVLASYFFESPSFNDFLNKSKPFQVARARKGMGKSALLSKFHFDLAKNNENTLVVRCLRSNLVGFKIPPQTEDYSVLENYWKSVICQSIISELGSTIGFAASDAKISAVEVAELNGFKGRNIIGALFSRIKGALGGLTLSSPAVPSHERLLRNISNNDDVHVWFLLDDVDSRFINSSYERALVSTFFSSARALVREVNGLNIRATVRTDVWSLLKTNEDLDKCEQYVCDIKWSNPQLDEMLAKKIYSYLARTLPTHMAKPFPEKSELPQLFDLVFMHRMSWGGENVPATTPIRILSGGRPRWMSQLCRLAGTHAVNSRSGKIGISEINQIMGKFGRLRLDDLYKEHDHQFSDLRRLIESFTRGTKSYTTDQLLKHLAVKYVIVVGAGNIPDIDGVKYTQVIQLARFMFKSGFIMGHNRNKATLAYPEFINFDLRPELLSVGTNLDDGLIWEVQPSYRTVLQIH